MMKSGVWTAIAVLSVTCAFGNDRKYVYFAWDLQAHGAKDFLAAADRFAQTPLDGVGLDLSGVNPDGRKIRCEEICQEPRWTKEAFANQVADYRALVQKQGFRDSFFYGFRAPIRRIDWTDDAGWATVAHNMGIVGWMARQCGVKGIVVDHEDYHFQKQFVRQMSDPSFEECRKLARRRGREVFEAAFREQPETVLLSFWFLSEGRWYFVVSDPDPLRIAKQDLWPDFVAGIIDALPPTARFIDGNEHAYRYEHSKCDFQTGVVNIRQKGVKLLPEDIRVKYLARGEQSFGQYIDMYVNPTNMHWVMREEGGSRLEHFRRNLLAATDYASEYVWIWGERRPWIDWPSGLRTHKGVRYDEPWKRMLPGLEEMMFVCKAGDAGEWKRFDALDGMGVLKNRLTSAVRFGVWQSNTDKKDKPVEKGVFRQENGVFTAESVANGCFLYEGGNIEAGERYAYVAKARGVLPSGQVLWMAKGRVVNGMPIAQMIFGAPDQDGWREGRVLLTVPPAVDGVQLQLGAEQAKGESTIYRDVTFCRLWPL